MSIGTSCFRVLIAGLAGSLLVVSRGRDVRSATLEGASIEGVVLLDEAPNPPVRRALVTVAGAALGRDRMAITADDGSFLFQGLPAGRYTVAASKAAYISVSYGSPRAGRGPGTPVVLGDGQRFSLTLRMLRGGVIAGAIADQTGRPRPDARVSLLEMRSVGGDKALAPVKAARTDDQGGYRFFGLSPGTYAVAALNATPADFNGVRVLGPADFDVARPGFAVASTGGPGKAVGYAPTLFPGTTDPASAKLIQLEPGEERSDVSFPLALVPTANISGVVVDDQGLPAVGSELLLVSAAQTLGFTAGGLTPRLSVGPDGRFSREAVVPGAYTLFARARERAPEGDADSKTAALTLWAQQSLSVAGDEISNVVVTLRLGMTISGRIRFDATRMQPPRDCSGAQVRLSPVAPHGANLTVAPARANADGTFRIVGIPPGTYTIGVSFAGAAGWNLKAALVGEMDILDGFSLSSDESIQGLSLIFGDRPAILAGSLVDSLGRPAPDYTVIVFAADQRFWRPGSRRTNRIRPGTDGTFSVSGLPPGAYLVAAVADLDPNVTDDDDFFAMLSRDAVSVTLTEGLATKVNLRLASGKVATNEAVAAGSDISVRRRRW